VTLERMVEIRRGLVEGDHVEPPLNESEMVTIVLLAEERLRDPGHIEELEERAA